MYSVSPLRALTPEFISKLLSLVKERLAMAPEKKMTFLTCVFFLVPSCCSCAARSRDLSRWKWSSNPLGDAEPQIKEEEAKSPSLPEDLKSLSDLLTAVAGESSHFLDPQWDSEEWQNSSFDSEEPDRDRRFSPAILSAALPMMTHFWGQILKPMLKGIAYRP